MTSMNDILNYNKETDEITWAPTDEARRLLTRIEETGESVKAYVLRVWFPPTETKDGQVVSIPGLEYYGDDTEIFDAVVTCDAYAAADSLFGNTDEEFLEEPRVFGGDEYDWTGEEFRPTGVWFKTCLDLWTWQDYGDEAYYTDPRDRLECRFSDDKTVADLAPDDLEMAMKWYSVKYN